MNTVKDWEKIYESGQDVRIKEILISLYAHDEWQELHVALWTWLSLDGTKNKYEWFDTFGIPKVKHHCFACKVAEESFDCLPKCCQEEIVDFEEEHPPFCHCCPITDSSAEECLDGLYRKWLTTYFKEREELAMEIANIKWIIK